MNGDAPEELAYELAEVDALFSHEIERELATIPGITRSAIGAAAEGIPCSPLVLSIDDLHR